MKKICNENRKSDGILLACGLCEECTCAEMYSTLNDIDKMGERYEAFLHESNLIVSEHEQKKIADSAA